MAVSPPKTLEKALDLLAVVVADDGARPFADLAREAGLPFSTARRLGASLERQGYLTRERPGRYLAGPRLLALAHGVDERRRLARLARPGLKTLARRLRQTVHLGMLEDGMVTYLAKEARGSAAAFTREGMQLEAYCSGVGKVLLAHLPEPDREGYLGEGPFVALTPNTIVEPRELRSHLETVRGQGWAMDDAEVFEGLKCLAVPIHCGGRVAAAVSVSAPAAMFDAAYETRVIAALKETARHIQARLEGRVHGDDD